MPRLTRPQVSRVLRELLPQRTWTRAELLQWLADTQQRDDRAKQPHGVVVLEPYSLCGKVEQVFLFDFILIRQGFNQPGHLKATHSELPL